MVIVARVPLLLAKLKRSHKQAQNRKRRVVTNPPLTTMAMSRRMMRQAVVPLTRSAALLELNELRLNQSAPLGRFCHEAATF